MLHVVGPLMRVKDPDKVRNQRVAKSRIVLIPIILILVKYGKSWLLSISAYNTGQQENEHLTADVRLIYSYFLYLINGRGLTVTLR